MHGNEQYGLKLKEKFEDKYHFIIGNPLAIKHNKRFINSDLNRVFPGNKFGNFEEIRATEILDELKGFDIVIDLHSSSSKVDLFGIVTKPNQEKINFASKLGLNKVVIMPREYAKNKALIDHVKCGISLEIGPHNDNEIIFKVEELLLNLESNKKVNPNLFEIFSIISNEEYNNIKIKNFKPVFKGEIIAYNGKTPITAKFDFIPILVNEKAYNNILCFNAKKLNNQ